MGRIVNVREKFILISILSLLAYVTMVLFEIVHETQPKPFIDEIFHIPQAQLFCKNVWTEWNPKITTLPGLYLLSYIILKPFQIVKENICTVYSLRLINVIGMLLNFVLSYHIISKLYDFSASKNKLHLILNLISAINIAIFPPIYFFTFLYYTDVWSLTLVLLLYYSHISNFKFVAAISGFLAVLMRQTNIIWIGLMILDDSWNVIIKSKEWKMLKPISFRYNIGKQLQKCFSIIVNNKEKFISLIRRVLIAIYPSVIVCIMFVIFVIVNGSVVVGDKRAHMAVLHPMQNLYFVDFMAFFGLPFFLNQVVSRRRLPNMYVLLSLTFICAILSEVNKLEHPYLLADNRHLAFYIWRRLFGHNVFRRFLIPTYAIAASILWDLLGHLNFIFKIFLGLSIFLNLTMQHLFELRYFIIPFVMCRLHFRRNIFAAVEFVYFTLINAFAIYIFLKKPFSWASEPDEVQRIIW